MNLILQKNYIVTDTFQNVQLKELQNDFYKNHHENMKIDDRWLFLL